MYIEHVYHDKHVKHSDDKRVYIYTKVILTVSFCRNKHSKIALIPSHEIII